MSNTNIAGKQEIRIYSVAMGERIISSSASNWKELQRELSTENISFSGMKAVIGETKLTLEADEAILPNTGFTLFLMPIKTKSGSYNQMGYKDLRKAVQDILATNASAKEHFNLGKNYTLKGTEELRSLLNNFRETPVKSTVKKAPVVGVVSKLAPKAAKVTKTPVLKVTKLAKVKLVTKPVAKPVVEKVPKASKISQAVSYVGMAYKELRDSVRNILMSNPDAGLHFNAGKNYTVKGTETLRALLNSFHGSVSPKASVKPVDKSVSTPVAKPNYDKVASQFGDVDKKSTLDAEYDRIASQLKDVKGR